MPRWIQHAKAFINLRRQWSVNAAFGEILTGVLPVVEVGKVRDDEHENVYGMFCQAVGDGVNVAACRLAALQKDLLVYKVEAWVDALTTRAPTMHMFTPLQTYDSMDVAVQNIFFPWFQGAARAPGGDPFGQATGALSEAVGFAGLGSGLMSVIVNGVPVTAIGPVYPYERWTTFAGSGGGFQPVTLWSAQDPPLRIRPFQSIIVQTLLGVMLGSGQPLNVNFYWSERSEQGQLP